MFDINSYCIVFIYVYVINTRIIKSFKITLRFFFFFLTIKCTITFIKLIFIFYSCYYSRVNSTQYMMQLRIHDINRSHF